MDRDRSCSVLERRTVAVVVYTRLKKWRDGVIAVSDAKETRRVARAMYTWG